MTNPFLNRFNTIYRGSRLLRPYFFSDLNTFYKKIVGTIFNEKINNLPARFLPRVAKFVSANEDYVTDLIPIYTTNPNVDITIKFKTLDDANNCVYGEGNTANTTQFIGIFINVDKITIQLRNDQNVLLINTISTINNLNDGNLHEINWKDVNGNTTLTIDGVIDGTDFDYTPVGTFTMNVASLVALVRSNITFYKDCAIKEFKQIKNNILQSHYYPTGQGSHEYDISGNNNHGVISGTGTHYDFDINGSTRPNDVGYSIWRKTDNPDIQVQFDINGAAISLTAGVNIPAGYSHERDVPAGGDKHNIYKSLVDMEYGSLLQCDTDGIAYVNQNDAYGLIVDGIFFRVGYILYYFNNNLTTVDDGYRLAISNDDRIYLNIMTAGSPSVLFRTAPSYVSDSTNYRLLVFRNETANQFVTGAIGTFVMYIQGKSKPITTTKYLIPNTNEMELVDPTGGSGTNPVTDNTYTTSKNIVIDNNAGDQISKIEVNGKYISPYDFTVSSGAYSIIDNPKNAIYNRLNQTAFSQASIFYNSDKPFIYHVTELADPRIYNKSGAEFLDGADRDRIFGKVKRDGTTIIRLDELANYANQKAGAPLTSVTNYNKITDIYHI